MLTYQDLCGITDAVRQSIKHNILDRETALTPKDIENIKLHVRTVVVEELNRLLEDTVIPILQETSKILESEPKASLSPEAREARLKGYEGDPCPNCGKLTLVRSHDLAACDGCGWRSEPKAVRQ
jgi:predicted RNA-binding Zn-ribbon protein involved in translation (DUF1610 family)